MKMVSPSCRLAALTLCAAFAGCGDDSADSGPSEADKRAVIEQYVAVVRADYAATVAGAEALQRAVDAFVAAPSAATLDAAKKAWLAAREPYGQSESFRFYEGPIDDPDADVEGQINGWPLDESFIDGTVDDANSGIINQPELFPDLTADALAALNGKDGGEDNIATGYHAIEFLLWGQDLSAEGPGSRPYTDYVEGEAATAANGARRGTYLKVVTDLLVRDLTGVRDAWKDDGYAKTFLGQKSDQALRAMLRGMTRLSGFELSGERMSTAWENEDQEDEHSCFSDNTHRDIYLNARAVENVYRGRFDALDGPGLEDLVKTADPALAADIDGQFTAVFAAIEAIPVPFDQALLDPAKKPKIKAAIDALVTLTDTLLEISQTLGLEPWE